MTFKLPESYPHKTICGFQHAYIPTIILTLLLAVAEASLPARGFNFDIDVTEKKLYMVNDESGELLRCDIAEVLDAIQRSNRIQS